MKFKNYLYNIEIQVFEINITLIVEQALFRPINMLKRSKDIHCWVD